MTSLAITVFITVYNGEKFLKDSIQSILSQTFLDFELLIVNDGSTDHSLEIISNFLSDPRVRTINNPSNMGILYSRNLALKEAKGKYLAILDSDDIATPNRLELQYQYLEKNEDVAGCGGHANVINEMGELLYNPINVIIDPHAIKMNLLFRNTFVHSTIMLRMAIFKEFEGYRLLNYAEDYDLFCRISEKYLLTNLDQYLVKYRKHSSNTSKIFFAEMAEAEHAIISNLQLKLGLKPTPKFIDVHHSLLNNKLVYYYSDYSSFLVALKEANQKSRVFKVDSFNKFLYREWILIINKKGGKNAVCEVFNLKLLDKISYLDFRSGRKALKKSIKAVFAFR